MAAFAADERYSGWQAGAQTKSKYSIVGLNYMAFGGVPAKMKLNAMELFQICTNVHSDLVSP